MITTEAINVQTIVDYIAACPFIDDFSTLLLTGITGDKVGECGVFDDGEPKALKTDMQGNQLLVHRYALVARSPTAQDIERIRATNFCARFQVWIREQEIAENYPALPTGYQAFHIAAHNAKLTARAEDGKTALYEIPIELQYWRFA